MEKSKRHHFNKVILEKLLQLNDEKPYFRFIHLLWASNIIHTDSKGEIVDDFYEESEVTWKRIIEYLSKNEIN